MLRTSHKRSAGVALQTSESKRVRCDVPWKISSSEQGSQHSLSSRLRTFPRVALLEKVTNEKRIEVAKENVKEEGSQEPPEVEIEEGYQDHEPGRRIEPIQCIPPRKEKVQRRLLHRPKKVPQSIDALFRKQNRQNRLDLADEECPGPPLSSYLDQEDVLHGPPSVNPLLWTQKHLQLLGCYFSGSKVKPSDRLHRHWRMDYDMEIPTGTYQSSKGFLAKLETTTRKLDTEGFIPHHNPYGGLSTIFDHHHKFNLPLRFGHRFDATVPTEAVFSHPRLSSSLPCLAIVDLSEVHARRNMLVAEYVADWNKINFHEKQKIHVGSGLEGEDPYIVAVLIALAQAQRCYLKEGKYPWSSLRNSPRNMAIPSHCEEVVEVKVKREFEDHAAMAEPTKSKSPRHKIGGTASRREAKDCFKVRVIAFSENAKNAFFYEASISKAFLSGFDAPPQDSPSTRVFISYYQMPTMNKFQIWDALDHVKTEPV